MAPSRVLILRAALGQGGADRVTLTLLRTLDRRTAHPSLALMRAEGEWLADIPPDVPTYDLRAAGLWSAWLPLWRHLRRHPPDVLFSMDSGLNITAAAAHAMAGRPGRLILSERNVLFHGGVTPKRLALLLLKRASYGLASAVAAVSRGVADDLVRWLGIPADRIAVVYNPVDLDEIERLAAEPVTHPWFGGDAPVVLGAGRLVREKDFPLLIDAFARVRSSHVARLVILGSGPQHSALQAWVRRLGVESDTWFAGFDGNPFKYMARCTVFVLSSRAEGFPNVLLQAMACGAPVLATRCHAGPEEIITDGEDGVLTPVGDPEALAARIIRLLDDPATRTALGEAAKRSVRRFSTDRIVPRYAALLHAVT